ncbi:MAG: hypothetical protein WBZ36_00435 [Candidatus Nitrosopolaris sp.]
MSSAGYYKSKRLPGRFRDVSKSPAFIDSLFNMLGIPVSDRLGLGFLVGDL